MTRRWKNPLVLFQLANCNTDQIWSGKGKTTQPAVPRMATRGSLHYRGIKVITLQMNLTIWTDYIVGSEGSVHALYTLTVPEGRHSEMIPISK